MEKRKLISLRGVLLRYLVQTALACVLAAACWLVLLLVLVGSVALAATQSKYVSIS